MSKDHLQWKYSAIGGAGLLSLIMGCGSYDEPVASEQLAVGGASCGVALAGASGSASFAVTNFSQGASYSGATDTTLAKANPTTNYGSSASLTVDGGSTERVALLRWDTSSIPSDHEVLSAQIHFEIEDTSVATFNVHWLLAGWNEAEATWEKRTSRSNWDRAGAQGTPDVAPVTVGSFQATQLATKQVCLNSSGINMIQGWVSNPGINFGVLLANRTHTDGIHVASSESGNFRPKLTVWHQP